VRRWASEAEIAKITGIARKTLQQHRMLGRGFPFYRHGFRIFYDVEEVEQLIRATRSAPSMALHS
jgi:hypothetical protein